jgi:hypothetical protein
MAKTKKNPVDNWLDDYQKKSKLTDKMSKKMLSDLNIQPKKK